MKLSFLFYAAHRYFFSKRKSKKLTPSLLSIFGISIGVAAIIIVLGVMNGFQLGFIDNIIEISSFHIRVDADAESIEAVQSIDKVLSVVPFMEKNSMLRGFRSQLESVKLLAVDPVAIETDKGFMKQLELFSGWFHLKEGHVLIGQELAFHLGASIGSSIHVIALSGKNFNALQPLELSFTVNGIFKTGYYEYDRQLCIFSIDDTSKKLFGQDVLLGLKISDRFRDKDVVAELDRMQLPASSWRDYNQSFFQALAVEKIAMFTVLALIFLVVAVNIFHSLQRTIFEKREEIAILASLGMKSHEIQKIFVLDGFFIGLFGGFFGLVMGIAAVLHINEIFIFIESVLAVLFSIFMAESSFRFFSSQIFYLSQVPAEIFPLEVMAAFVFAILSSTSAAFLASRKILKLKPVEILRYE